MKSSFKIKNILLLTFLFTPLLSANPYLKNLSQPARKFIENVDAARKGEDVDLNGDGFKETQTVLRDGGRWSRVLNPLNQLVTNQFSQLTSEQKAILSTSLQGVDAQFKELLNGKKKKDYNREWEKINSKTWELKIDLNYDKIIERYEKVTKGPPHKREIIIDYDADGKPDKKIFEEYHLAKDIVVYHIEEKDLDGKWHVKPKIKHSLWMNQEAGHSHSACDGNAGFPKDTEGGTSIALPSSPGIRIPIGKNGRCSEAQGKKILDGLSCALGEGRECLNKQSPETHQKLFEKMRDGELIIGCGNTCKGFEASTRVVPWIIERMDAKNWGKPIQTKLNLNPSRLDMWSNNQSCTILLHEILHWAGEGTHDAEDHNNGKDKVYACARYCGGKTTSGPWKGSEGHPGVGFDCSRCADDKINKIFCGGIVEFDNVPCTPNQTCLKPDRRNWKDKENCSKCKRLVSKTCDGLFTHYRSKICCAGWPSGSESICWKCKTEKELSHEIHNTCNGDSPIKKLF